jgi:microcystin-dependent protein
MAKPGLTQVTTAQTFQAWLDKTNDIVDILKTDAITASAGSGDTTTGNATLVGSLTANTVIAFDTLRADVFSPKSGSTSISATAPINTTTSLQVAQTLTSTAGPRINFSSTSNIWRAGFENTTDNNFIVDIGSGTPKLRLTTTGNLSVAGSVTAGTGGFVGNLTGNVTGNITGSITGNVTGNVTGNLTGSVTVPSGGILNASNASSISLPVGFGLVPTGGIIMWSGSAGAIPTGWALCNGSGGTPDLRGRFVVGFDLSDPDYNTVGETGGAKSVTLTEAQMPAHTHAVSGTTNNTGAHIHTFRTISTGVEGSPALSGVPLETAIGERVVTQSTTDSAGAHTHTVSGTAALAGGGTAHENRPPYYTICFIIKT